MHRMNVLMFFFLMAVMTLVTSQGYCENWKEYHKHDDITFYYDKDSIHYPEQKKSIFGLTVKNKEIVNVWVHHIDKESGKISDNELWTIYCATREKDDHRPYDSRYPFADIFGPPRGPIKPGDIYESLLKKVCP